MSIGLWTQIDTPQGKRRVRADAINHVTNDAREVHRLELKQDLLKLALRRGFFAPVSTPERILDVGAGTGHWGMELLQQFPLAQLIALDNDTVLLKHYFTKKQPDGTTNAERFASELTRMKFVQADATKGLPFEEGCFDYTHTRIPDTFLSEENWPRLIREMARVTRREGWVEIMTTDYFYSEQPSAVITTMLDVQRRLCEAANIAPTGGPGMAGHLKEADITVYRQRTDTVGRTPKQRKLLVHDIKLLIEPTRSYVLQFGIITAEQFDSLLGQFEEEGLRAGFFMPFHSIWFQPRDQPKLHGSKGDAPS